MFGFENDAINGSRMVRLDTLLNGPKVIEVLYKSKAIASHKRRWITEDPRSPLATCKVAELEYHVTARSAIHFLLVPSYLERTEAWG